PTGRIEEHFSGDDGTADGGGPSADQHSDLRRDGRRKDDISKYSVAVDSEDGTHRDHRRCRGAAAGTAEYRAPRNPSAERGRARSGAAAAAAHQQPAHAAGSHHYRG